MKKKIAKAKCKLSDSIVDALSQFTHETGLTVSSVHFTVAQAKNGKDQVVATDYYGVTASVEV